MKKMKGFTLLELMIAMMTIFAFVMIIGTAVVNSGNPNVSFGVNGVVERRCVGGYWSNVGADGSARQVISENGGGIACR